MKIFDKSSFLLLVLVFANCFRFIEKKSVSPDLANDNGNTAVLILDVQMDFFKGGIFELEKAEEAAANGKKILEFFRKNNLPVFHIQHVSTRKGATFFFPGTKGVQFHPSHSPLPGETTIVKHTVNPFQNTNLFAELEMKNVKRLVIFGMMTHMVVDSTVRAAYDLGYRDIVVIADACATKDLFFKSKRISAQLVQSAFLSSLGYIFAKVKDTDEFLKDNSDDLRYPGE